MNDIEEQLRIEIEKLNAQTEKINRILTKYEEKLKELNPGVTAWFMDEKDKKKKWGYYRFSEGWHLAVQVEDEPARPILHSARYYRLAMLNRFPQVLQAILETVKALTEKMEKVEE
jgi:hypothetical protein